MLVRRISWFLFAGLSTIVGIYPLAYLFVERTFGLLSTKNAAVLDSLAWNVGFYTHIFFSGLALMIGWTQFHKNLRRKHPDQHRKIGKLYIMGVIPGGLSGLYISLYATGGLVSTMGFGVLAALWLSFTLLAYNAARNKNFVQHRSHMIISFALCFAAVTLRLWLPILTAIFGEFETAYQIVSWLCWVPNLIFAFILVGRLNGQPAV